MGDIDIGVVKVKGKVEDDRCGEEHGKSDHRMIRRWRGASVHGLWAMMLSYDHETVSVSVELWALTRRIGSQRRSFVWFLVG
jgi:hypothetical protein